MKNSERKISGGTSAGRSVVIHSIATHAGGMKVVMLCEGGDCYYQHSMTPIEAREVAGYLLAEANYSEQEMQGEEVTA